MTLGQGVFVFQMATASVAVGKLRLCFIFVGANLLACHFSFGSELVCYWRRSVCWWVLWSLGLRLFCGHARLACFWLRFYVRFALAASLWGAGRVPGGVSFFFQ